MEIKKSQHADLERQRPQRLLLGLVVALACLFVALEYTVEPDDPLDDPDLLARLDNEMELPPLLAEENLQSLVPKAEPKPETKLVVVEEEQTETLIDEEWMETDVADDMEAEEEETEPEELPVVEDEVFSLRIVQDVPQFPGGLRELMKWLTRNLKYPTELVADKVEGTVVAEFIVNADGSITDVKLANSLHPKCDDEVLRVLRMMPRWKPGIMNDAPCRTKVAIPFDFKY